MPPIVLMRRIVLLRIEAMGVALLTLLSTAAAEVREVEMRSIDSEEHIRVKRIRFVHLREKPFSDSYLRTAMTTRAGADFRRRFFRDDLTAIENLYRGNGYLDVDIVGKRFLIDDEDRLHVRLKIDSGQRWQIAVATLELDEPFDDLKLAQQLTVESGDSFIYKQVLDDERRLLARLNSVGYAHAQVRNQTELDGQKKRASVSYVVVPGRRMYFGDIHIRQRNSQRDLKTRSSLVLDKLTFRQGQLFNPNHLRLTRNNLSRTDLFRSVTLATPPVAASDSLQPVEIWLAERKFIRLEANAFTNNTEPGVSATFLHGNWLGRGTRVGLDANLGRPIQGGNLYLTERNVLDSGADLTVSAGLTDEWGQRQVFADPADSVQFALLSENDSVINGLLFFAGEVDAAEYIASSIYSYRSIERLWQFKSVLSRTWRPSQLRRTAAYQAQMDLNWKQSRNHPRAGGRITYNTPSTDPAAGAPADPAVGDDPFAGEDPFGGDPFGDEDPFAGDDPFADPGQSGNDAVAAADSITSGDTVGGSQSEAAAGCDPGDTDYACGVIRIDDTWRRILTDEAKTLNLSLSFQRDSRDDQIAPSRGTLMRAAALYALQFGGQSTRVLDGDLEWRHYVQLGPNVVWAQAARALWTASLRQDRSLPQDYWIEFGGEGSVRGVDRKSIQAIGGGRGGANLRSELRLRAGDFGLVAFWDRAGVWRHARKATWSTMVDGYGFGLRYARGIPFRLDVGWSEDFSRRSIYFSIGQAF